MSFVRHEQSLVLWQWSHSFRADNFNFESGLNSWHSSGRNFGRRRPVQLAICLHAVFYVALAFTKHKADYSIVFTLCEMCNCFIWTTFSAYGVEVTGPRFRVYFGSLVGVAHSIGFVLVATCAMFVPDRQLLTLILAALFALNLAYVAFIPESPVWALSAEQYDEARI